METMHLGTEKISPLYKYIPIKKDPSLSEKSSLVNQVGSNWNRILSELHEWHDYLGGNKLIASVPAGSRIS
jgi:hypothetical protein